MINPKHGAIYGLLLFIIMIPSFSNHLFAQKIVKEESNGSVKLWIEAESGQIDSPMKVHEKNDASGGRFVEVLSGNNDLNNAPENGWITYKFSVNRSGIYKVWGRVIASMDDEDAFWAKMDDGKWIKWNDISVGCKWHWDVVHDNERNNQVMKFELGEGQHQLVITYCLDQTRLDKLLITNDLNFVPTQIGPGVQATFKISSNKPTVKENVLFDGSGSSGTEGAPITYDWDFGDGTTARGKLIHHIYNEPGDYTVKLKTSDDKGFTGIHTRTITVYTNDPVASFTHSPDRTKAGEIVSFDASGAFDPNGEIKKYVWDFGDDSFGEGMNTRHAYAASGEYNAKLTVTDSEGKTASITQLVTVITGTPKKVIFDTDMCLDVDDVGALATLHALANNGEAEILAVCYNEVQPFAASAIDAINTWYGRGNIPIGIYKKPLFKPDYSPYLESVAQLPHDLDRKSASSAVEVYQKALSGQPDSSVTIISVGFLNNLSDLLRENHDLVARKVKELVIMGGIRNDGFNLSRHHLVSESENVIKNWPTPIVFSGAGGNIFTGPALENSPEGNPVREAYYKFFHNNFCRRPSWDQMTVLYAVRGLSDYFLMESTGTGALINGFTWQMKPGYRSFLKTLLPAESYARTIQNLMLEPPMK